MVYALFYEVFSVASIWKFPSGILVRLNIVFHTNPRNKIMIKQELLDIIACPKCKGSVRLNEGKTRLICPECELAYAIRDNIPIMLLNEAESLNQPALTALNGL